MGTIRVERRVQTPADAAWEAIADVEAVSEYASNVSRAIALDPIGEGMHRRCWDHDDNQWDEECILWEPHQRYSFAVDTSTSENKIHRLFHQFIGTFEVYRQTDETVFAVEFQLQPKYGPFGVLMFKWMQPRMYQEVARMVDDWAAEIERQRISPPL